MRPRVRSLDGLLHICYDLNQRVHTSKIYPLASPNGSAIVVCGSESGLRLVWRGGRPLKQAPKPTVSKPNSNPNGVNKDTIMVDDSDEEQPVNESYQDSPMFEDEEEEYDASEPYESIIQTLDLPLGVEVLHLAFPHIPAGMHQSSLESLPALLFENLVCAMACSDFSIRVLTIPLVPPSLESKMRPEFRSATYNVGCGQTLFGEQMITLSSGTIHRSIPKGVSISFTASASEEPLDVDMNEDETNLQGPALLRHASQSRSRSRLRDQPWDLLIASYSADLHGLLLIHRIPLVGNGSRLSTKLHVPWRIQRLASPAISVDFSIALYPAPNHSQLLVAEAKGVVRILDCLPKSGADQDLWLLSLYTDFETSQSSIPKRKSIIDARWVLGGRAILVYLCDGKWGVWDLDNAGPKSLDASNASSRPDLTKFALDGWIGDSLKPQALFQNTNSKIEQRSKLAPMTPSTRKMKQDVLFGGPTSQPEGPARGGLSVSLFHDPSGTRTDDESVVLWHGSIIIVIPSLFTHWQNKVKKSGNLFGAGAKGESQAISNIQLGGESCNEVVLFPKNHHRHTNSTKDTPNRSEILITGERRLLVLAPPLSEPEVQSFSASSQKLSSSADQALLSRGELDVAGMDRILDGMSNGHNPKTKAHANGEDSLISL